MESETQHAAYCACSLMMELSLMRKIGLYEWITNR
jgi:hypothetical protein